MTIPARDRPLLAGDEQMGEVVRTARVKPLFVSIGHRITLPEAVALVLACCTRYRLPEPARRTCTLHRWCHDA